MFPIKALGCRKKIMVERRHRVWGLRTEHAGDYFSMHYAFSLCYYGYILLHLPASSVEIMHFPLYHLRGEE